MPLKDLTKRLKKAFSFRSRGAYDFKDQVDPALRRHKTRDKERSLGDSDGYYRRPSEESATGIAGVWIGSTNSLQPKPQPAKARPANRASVGSLNDLPTVEHIVEAPPALKVPKYSTEYSLALPTNSRANDKGEKVTAGEIKHFKKGVQLTAGRAESDTHVEHNIPGPSSVEHNLIYQGVAFRHPQRKEAEIQVESSLGDIEELDDPNYSTIPHFAKKSQNKCETKQTPFASVSNKDIPLENTVGDASGGSGVSPVLEEPGYSTVPEARAAVRSLFSTDTDFVNINNYSAIPEATLSLDDDPGYETLDEAKKKVLIINKQSAEDSNQVKGLHLRPEVKQTVSAAVQTDDIYDNNLIFPFKAANVVNDNTGLTPLVSPQSCVSGYHSLGNSPSSPPCATGVSVLSSQDSGIDGSGPVCPATLSPPHLVKLNSSQPDSRKTPKKLHTATLVTVTGEPNQQTFVVDEGLDRVNTGITETSSSQYSKEVGDEELYSIIGNKRDKPIDSITEVEHSGMDDAMDTDDVAPPVPTRNYLLTDSQDKTSSPGAKHGEVSKNAEEVSLPGAVAELTLSNEGVSVLRNKNASGRKSETLSGADKQDTSSVNVEPLKDDVEGDFTTASHQATDRNLNCMLGEVIHCSLGAASDKSKLPVTSDCELMLKTHSTGGASSLQAPPFPTEEKTSSDRTKHVKVNEPNGNNEQSQETETRSRSDSNRDSEHDQTSDSNRNSEHDRTSSNRNSEHDRTAGHNESFDSSSGRPHSGTSGSGSSNPNSPGASSMEESQIDFVNSLKQLKESGWYWGPLNASEAEAKLANKPDGSFLVRDSSDERYILSISFNSQGSTHHTRIEHYKGHFSFYSQPTSHGYGTITEFIERVMDHSRNGSFSYFLRPSAPGSPPMQVRLLFPVSRLRVMRSLQHMCRFRLLTHVRIDHIDSLPLPERVREYLKAKQYYIEFLED